jgi:glycosyltransferase involved in cell wall biosynthesis
MSFFSLPEDFRLLDGARRRALTAASMRASRRVIAVSEFTRREILAVVPDAAPRLVAIPEGGDDDLPPPPDRAQARRRLGVEGDLLLWVGSIFNRRPLRVLLQALALLGRSGVSAQLDVVGDNRTHPRLDLPALARELGVERRVSFSGFVGEAALADRYAAADAFVFLSFYEGFGLPVLEAMARGIPAITAARPALSELFAGSALLVDPGDAGALASALQSALRHPLQREELRRRGRQLADRHSWAVAAERTRALLEEAARG